MYKENETACFPRVMLFTVLLACALTFAQGGADDAGKGGYDAPYFQADFTQDLNSWTSTLVNPALTHRVNQMHAAMAFYRWGVDRGQMGYQDFTFLQPIRLSHTVGLTILHARNSMDRVKVVEGTDMDLSGGETVSYQDFWLIGNYGVRVLPWLMLGANVKTRVQTQFGQTAISNAPGLDVGVYLNPFDHYHWGDFGISLVAQDIMPTQTPWEFGADGDFALDVADLVTVSRGRAGVRWAGLNDNLILSFEMLVDNAFRDILKNIPWYDIAEAFTAGGETPSLSDLGDYFPIAFRWGFHAQYMFIPQIWFKAGWTNNNIPYLGFSYNLLYPMPEMINYFTIDYNFGYSFLDRSANLNDERGLVSMIRASTDFGRTREQKESRRMYNKLVVAPMDAYQEAMRLYTADKYWEAAFAFGRLMTLYPTFYLNDKAVYYMGDCYKKLYMNETAREVFKDALEEYTTSDMRAHYLYGIMSLDYREENFDEAMRNHSFITNLYAESDIVGEAEYLAGEIEFIRGDMDAAMAHFERVTSTDPSYLHALYTLAIINFETERHQAAILNLRAIIGAEVSSSEDVNLQHAAAIKLGHVYFEMGEHLREAAEAFSMVPSNTPRYGDEALLGLAWTWARAGQSQQILQNADRIVSQHPQSPFVPEAHLLRGYAFMQLKRYHDAVGALERSLATAQTTTFLTDDDVKTRQTQFDRELEEFRPIAERIKRNAMRRPTPRTLEERPELHKNYEKFAKENQENFEYRMLAKSHRHFFMRKDEIIDDANYALVRATSSARRAPAGPDSRGEEERLRQEIERLQREME